MVGPWYGYVHHSAFARLFCGALEAEEALDVEVGALLEARPVGVLGVHGVQAELVDDHAVAERLVPSVDPQRPGTPASEIEFSRFTQPLYVFSNSGIHAT